MFAYLIVLILSASGMQLYSNRKNAKVYNTMHVESGGPEIAEKFQQYLKQWNEPRFGLSE